MAIYLIPNGPMQTTAMFAQVPTSTAIKTLLQIKASATNVIKVKEWGIFLDNNAASSTSVELIETDVAATVTASVANDISKIDAAALANGDQTTNLIVVGTSATGYTATAEGSITAIRNLDGPQFLTTGTTFGAQFVKQFPLGNEPIIQISKFLRVRVKSTAAVHAYCYVVVEV